MTLEIEQDIKKLLDREEFSVQEAIDWLVEKNILLGVSVESTGITHCHIRMISGAPNSVESDDLSSCILDTLCELLEESEDGLEIEQSYAKVIPFRRSSKKNQNLL